MTMMTRYVALAFLLSQAVAFTPISLSHQGSWRTYKTSSCDPATVSALFHNNNKLAADDDKNTKLHSNKILTKLWRRSMRRFGTLESAGIQNGQISGLFGKAKQLHNPKTYLLLSLLAMIKWNRCFYNPYYWFVVGFLIKWYRARYVFKIPVWDRQPNWNNIITSKEQEKDLKAYTCKKCGSTIFIAKTREFFFEGDTGEFFLFVFGPKLQTKVQLGKSYLVRGIACSRKLFLFTCIA
jgi:hypothetical protein